MAQTLKSLSTVKYILFFLCCVILSLQEVYATHIKAADLYATINPDNLISPNSHRVVRFTLTVYCRRASVGESLNPANCNDALGNCVTLDYGDGTSFSTRYSSKTLIDEDTYQFIYIFNYTYSSDRFYQASYIDENRNNNILNLKSPSDQLPFFISMGLIIENGLGVNQTPQMTVPPVDNAETLRRFIHNPGAFDVNGDSISYFSYTPQINRGINAPEYRDPNLVQAGLTQDGTSGATYAVNELTGDVTWDSPVKAGLYNVAFVIEEWRTIGNRKIRMSYTVRDMQIEVKDGKNRQPIISPLTDVCVEAGHPLQRTINARDPDGDLRTELVNLTLEGELVKGTTYNKGTLQPTNNPSASPISKIFAWNTTCNDVRNRPYQAVFRATDVVFTQVRVGNEIVTVDYSLTDVKSFFITVVGPRPTGLRDTIREKSVDLTWNRYACGPGSPGAFKMQIFRRVGCDAIIPKNCEIGAPDGYIQIGEVDIEDTTFSDLTATRGNVYSYRIVAQFKDVVRLNSPSYPSTNVCVELPLIAPIITKVSFEGDEKTSLLINWNKPIDVDTSQVKGPYTYLLFRKKVDEAGYTLLKDFGPQIELADSSYLDTGIEPATSYVYYVRLNYFQKDSLVFLADSSEVSTNVSLTTTGVTKGIALNWQASTPWSNTIDTLYHFIWRKRENDTGFVLIDSVKFTSGTQNYSYTDLGSTLQPLKEKETISYFVTAAGSYQNKKILPIVTLNNSFISKNKVPDLTPPCPPVLENIVYDCSKFNQVFPYFNVVNWNNLPYSPVCEMDIVGYNVYYSRKKEEDPIPFLVRLVDLPELIYRHSGLSSVSGCYAVTAFDSSGNESSKSNVVCVETCKLYELPNVFTPNASGENDVFRPISPSPMSVESVEFKVFNRWGQKVYERNDDIYLNWDGSGLPDGVYFYSAKVKFVSFNSEEAKELKGWIQIIR